MSVRALDTAARAPRHPTRESGDAAAQPTGVTPIVLEGERLAGFETLAGLEWLETNGLGGWASGTLSGAATRRYHGLLVAAGKPPVDRRLLVAKLAETVCVGAQRIDLDANRFPHDTVHPRGFERLVRFERGRFPVFEYATDGFRLTKTVVGVHGENTTVVVYELGSGSAAVELELRPFLAGRDIHALGRELPARRWEARPPSASGTRFESVAGEMAVTISVPGALFEEGPDWWRRFEYDEERRRGFDWTEDLFTPGRFRVALEPGRRVAVVVTAEPATEDGDALVAREAARRDELVERAGLRAPVARRLVLAADQFLVRRDDGWTVIAGYPWFSDWGRDAMIALPGLCLSTRRYEEAKGILRTFARAVDAGMLPNRFPDGGEAPEYNTVDATLWFFVAAWRYLEATGDERFVLDELLPVLDEILAWHGRGTRFGIRVDGDGLLTAGEPGVQLTWMDARVEGREITPRTGKPVEIQALWINALRIAAALHRRSGRDERAGVLERLAEAAVARVEELFWSEARQALADVVVEAAPDLALRPNQLYALALPWPSIGPARARAALATMDGALLTPRGLRTLAPDDPAYRARYEGGPRERDGAYHQGTVWPFLLGVYVCALLRFRNSAGHTAAVELLEGFAPHLEEAAVGTVSEIFDAEAPHRARGAVAQAWSVAELLRAYRALESGGHE